MTAAADSDGTDGAALAVPPRHPERLVYFGTPDMAVAPLEALDDAGFDIALVVTGADKRRGRGQTTSPTPVKLAALGRGLPVTHDLADVAYVDADLGVVVAYGHILKRPLLEVLPMVNLHFSLLPRWRGAAPVERAILAGDERTGVCVMAVEEGLDTGGIHASVGVAIRRTSTATELGEQLTSLGSTLLVDTLRGGLGVPQPQVGEPTYAAKITAGDLCLDWTRPAVVLERVVRVGGAWTTFRGQRLKLLQARAGSEAAQDGGAPGQLIGTQVVAGQGMLTLVRVQPEGRAAMAAADWLNGTQPTVDDRLGNGE